MQRMNLLARFGTTQRAGVTKHAGSASNLTSFVPKWSPSGDKTCQDGKTCRSRVDPFEMKCLGGEEEDNSATLP